jgi:hypothetical protein
MGLDIYARIPLSTQTVLFSLNPGVTTRCFSNFYSTRSLLCRLLLHLLVGCYVEFTHTGEINSDFLLDYCSNHVDHAASTWPKSRLKSVESKRPCIYQPAIRLNPGAFSVPAPSAGFFAVDGTYFPHPTSTQHFNEHVTTAFRSLSYRATVSRMEAAASYMSTRAFGSLLAAAASVVGRIAQHHLSCSRFTAASQRLASGAQSLVGCLNASWLL